MHKDGGNWWQKKELGNGKKEENVSVIHTEL